MACTPMRDETVAALSASEIQHVASSPATPVGASARRPTSRDGRTPMSDASGRHSARRYNYASPAASGSPTASLLRCGPAALPRRLHEVCSPRSDANRKAASREAMAALGLPVQPEPTSPRGFSASYNATALTASVGSPTQRLTRQSGASSDVRRRLSSPTAQQAAREAAIRSSSASRADRNLRDAQARPRHTPGALVGGDVLPSSAPRVSARGAHNVKPAHDLGRRMKSGGPKQELVTRTVMATSADERMRAVLTRSRSSNAIPAGSYRGVSPRGVSPRGVSPRGVSPRGPLSPRMSSASSPAYPVDPSAYSSVPAFEAKPRVPPPPAELKPGSVARETVSPRPLSALDDSITMAQNTSLAASPAARSGAAMVRSPRRQCSQSPAPTVRVPAVGATLRCKSPVLGFGRSASSAHHFERGALTSPRANYGAEVVVGQSPLAVMDYGGDDRSATPGEGVSAAANALLTPGAALMGVEERHALMHVAGQVARSATARYRGAGLSADVLLANDPKARRLARIQAEKVEAERRAAMAEAAEQFVAAEVEAKAQCEEDVQEPQQPVAAPQDITAEPSTPGAEEQSMPSERRESRDVPVPKDAVEAAEGVAPGSDGQAAE